jgi:hypothetical protein
MSCKYTVKRLVYKNLSEAVNGNRSVSSSYYIQLSLQAYSELMNCIYIRKQKADNLAVNYKRWRSFGPLRWLFGFMSRRILLWLLYVLPYAVTLKNHACHPHSVFVAFLWVSEQTPVKSLHSRWNGDAMSSVRQELNIYYTNFILQKYNCMRRLR